MAELVLEVINTGDELLLGRCVNTHLAFFGQRLFDVGLRVARQIAIPDGDPIRVAMEDAFNRADIVVMTGGLGPTSDDLTRDVAAELLGVSMREDPRVVEAITDRLGARGREVRPDSLRQALVPEGAEVLMNPHGTAPGLYVPAGASNPHLFLLPGPPRELRPMVNDQVLPRLRAIVGGEKAPTIRHFKFFGIGESEVGAWVERTLAAIPGLEYGYMVEPANVNVRCIGPDDVLAQAETVIREALGGYLVSTDGASLEEVVVRRLRERGESLATSESCTGGLIASTLTNVSGASEVFRRGFVTYANEAKAELLGIDPNMIANHGAVSPEVASAMAAGCLEASGDTHAVSVTGIAGPAGGTDEKPAGTVYVGVVSQGDPGVDVRRFFFPYEREMFKMFTCKTVLDLVRQRLA